MRLQLFFSLLATLLFCGRGQVEIHIAFITSFEGEYDSSVTVPAVQLATNRINNDPGVLGGHKLVVELIDNITIARSFANSQVIKSNENYVQQYVTTYESVRVILFYNINAYIVCSVAYLEGVYVTIN